MLAHGPKALEAVRVLVIDWVVDGAVGRAVGGRRLCMLMWVRRVGRPLVVGLDALIPCCCL